MKRLLACLLAAAAMASTAQAWRPAGWVFHDYPWACDGATGDWYWFNPADVQWVARMDNGQWARLPESAMATGWVFYEWPYASAQGNGAWHWINEADVQWVANMRTGEWSRFGKASDPAGNGEGIFADFETSMGVFTVRLDYERAPRAVASFVGLATGDKTWSDPQGNLWNRPFYDGSIFHRVVKDGAGGHGIAVQGGGFPSIAVDTNGVATTNFAHAGYAMVEAFGNGLLHSNGAISLAHSSMPNSDGSQFFITASNMPSWNGAYTVFGHVTTGMEAVAAIAAVPVQGARERPVNDVALNAVRIRRVGSAAAAFDAEGQGVPVLETAPMRATTAGSHLEFRIELEAQSQTTFRESGDLRAWTLSDLGLHTGSRTTLVGQISRQDLGDAYFFHSARVAYPEAATTPTNNRGKAFTFLWDTQGVKYQVAFSTNALVPGQGWVTQGTNAPYPRVIFVGDGWTRRAYSATLYFFDDLGREYTYDMGFVPGQATNRFTGGYRNYGVGEWIPTSGFFTMP